MERRVEFIVRRQVVTGDLGAGGNGLHGSEADSVPIHIGAGFTTVVQEGVGVLGALDVFVVVDLDGQAGRMVDDRSVVRNQDFFGLNIIGGKQTTLAVGTSGNDDF